MQAQAASAKSDSSQVKSLKKSAQAKPRAKVKNKKRVAKRAQRSYQAALDAELDRAVANGELALRSHSALVINQATGELIYTKNPDVETPIASITKLMTAMVTLDAGLPLDEEITINS